MQLATQCFHVSSAHPDIPTYLTQQDGYNRAKTDGYSYLPIVSGSIFIFPIWLHIVSATHSNPHTSAVESFNTMRACDR